LRPFRAFRTLWPFYTLRSVRSFNLHHAGSITPLLAMVSGHLVGPIEPSGFPTTVVPPVFTTVFSTIQPPIFPTVRSSVLPPDVAGLRHTIVVSTTTAGPTI
jgi:hypothetical protein